MSNSGCNLRILVHANFLRIAIIGSHIVERCLNHGKQSAVASIYNRFLYQKEMAAAWFLWSKHVEVLVTAKQAVAA